MSLICGILSRDDRALASPAALEAMLAVTRHRARDGQVAFLDPAEGLALAYCHTATFGHDKNVPSWHEDERVVAAVDGDIYDTAAHLQSHMSEYSSHHAGAVVESYKAGEGAFPAGLDGMFSLFLWDRAQKTLHLSSNPLGRRLVYYYHDLGRDLLVFSTELKGVLAHPAVPRQLDEKVLPLFLHQGMTPAPFSLISGTKKLLPAECLVFGPSETRSRRFWQPEIESGPEDFDFWVQRTRTQMVKATRRTIGNAERVALYLSGGIDSSVVTAALLLGDAPHTEAFTIAYKDQLGSGTDDLEWARRTAAAAQIPFHPVSVDPELSITPDLMSTLLAQIDEPFDSATRILNEYFLGQAAEDSGFESVLNGLDGSPIIAFQHALDTAGANVPSVDKALRTYFESKIILGEERITEALVKAPDLTSIAAASLANRDLVRRFTPAQAVHVANLLRNSSSRYTAYCHYIPPLYGQEERSPYFDTQMALLCASFPAAFDGSRSPDMERSIIRAAFRDLLPSDFDRRPKRAFPNAPLPAWLKQLLVPGLQPLVDDGIVKPEYLLWLDKNCKKGRPRAWREAWQWFVLSCWYQFQIKQTDPFANAG